MKKYKLLLFILTVLITFNGLSLSVKAEPYIDLVAKSAILIEETTGKVLYKKNENAKMYPASMTKMLTAAVALDYLKPEDVIVVGREINNIPTGSSLAGHKVGESITVENLIRGLLIPSGGESSLVIAKNVVMKAKGLADVNYAESERIFADMMNEKAKNLGITNSHFANSHGFHDNNHYSTAADMAVIARAAMAYPVIRKIVAEPSFVGNGAGIGAVDGVVSQEYNWANRNLLLDSKSEFFYPYATGIKTGFSDEASDCFAASAEKDGKKLIAIVMFSPEPGRWNDAEKLFEYGFNNFNEETIQEAGQKIGVVKLSGMRLGDDTELEYFATLKATAFMSKEELSRIKQEVVFNEELLAKDENKKTISDTLAAPIAKGDVIGTVTYSLDDKVIFKDGLTSGADVLERTVEADVKYYVEQFKKTVFSAKAIPYWAVGVGVVALVSFISISIARANNRRNRRYSRRRY